MKAILSTFANRNYMQIAKMFFWCTHLFSFVLLEKRTKQICTVKTRTKDKIYIDNLEQKAFQTHIIYATLNVFAV